MITKSLTPKQNNFSRYVAEGLSLSDSYRRSYDTSNSKECTIHQAACRLMAHDKIIARVEELNRMKDRATVTSGVSDRDRTLTKLRHLLDNAKGTPAETVMLRAADLLGRSAGLYKDVVLDKEPRTPEEIESELLKRLSEAETPVEVESKVH